MDRYTVSAVLTDIQSFFVSKDGTPVDDTLAGAYSKNKKVNSKNVNVRRQLAELRYEIW